MSLLTRYDEYRPVVLQAARRGSDQSPAFTQGLKQKLKAVWPIVQARWRMLAATLDFGFDWSHEMVDLAITDPLWDGKTIETRVASDRGWQSIGVRFAPGTQLTISAGGRCTINDQPKPWISEPAGVTIHYANDRPLGQLLVCVLPNQTRETRYLKPLEIHAVEDELKIELKEHCWLLFRINDYLDDLDNNRGDYTVWVRRERNE